MASDISLDGKVSYQFLNTIKNHNPGASAPSNKATGELWYDTSTGNLSIWSGSAWVMLMRVDNVANGTVACVLTASSGPTGAQTAVQGWFRINVGGTNRYVPFW